MITLITALVAGQMYSGTIVACAKLDEARVLIGLVTTRDMGEVKTYMQAEDNSCGVGESKFTPKEQIASVEDSKGLTWSIVKIQMEAGEAYLVTSSTFEAEGSDI